MITYHRSTSYGACLQALATQKILQELGHDVTVIDYINSYEQRIKKVFFSEDGTVKSAIKNGIKSLVFKRNYWLNKAFSDFYRHYKLTERQYHKLEEMSDLTFDALVVGSDQVWNPQISGKLDHAFLLKFGNANKRFSIASSFGSYELNKEERNEFKELAQKFTGISVRENFASNQLHSMGVKNVKVLCDPTMMISGSSWRNFSIRSNEEKYILTYFVSGSFCNFANEISRINKEYKLPIYNIQSSNYKWRGVDRTIVGAKPEEFLGLLDGAELVITDSFHGTVFSLLFHRPFVVINNRSNPIRINELLSRVGLEKCDYLKYKEVYHFTDKDFTNVDNKIYEMQVEAKEWISSMINEISG